MTSDEGSVANDRPTAELAVVDAPPADLPVVDDEEWLSSGPARGFRLRVPTAILLALLVAAGAFWGGAVAEKHHNPPAATGRGGLLATALGAGAAAGGVSGTVSSVKGDTLTITEASGAKVAVRINSSTTVARTSVGAAGPAKVGDTAVVVGTNVNGTITATRVTLVGKGATAGRFGGGFSPGTGFGGAGTEPNGSGTAGSGGTGAGGAGAGGAGSGAGPGATTGGSGGNGPTTGVTTPGGFGSG